MSSSNPAETYESYMVPVLFAPWASGVVETASPQSGKRVLDLGCGTGIVARTVAPALGESGQLVGLDLNPDMIEAARAVAARDGLVIGWREGRAEVLPFADGSFDLVLCQFALMFFADRKAALTEVHRVLAKHGRISLSVWQGLDRHPFYQTLHEVIAQRLEMSGVQEIFALGDASAFQTLLVEAGCRSVEIESVSMTARFPDPAAFLAGEIAGDTAAIPSMQHLDKRARQAITAAIAEEIEEPLRAITEGDDVVIPFHAHIALARRN